MNRSEILKLVYDAILHRPTNAGVHWYLCWLDGKIQCLPMGGMDKPEILFGTPTTYQLEKGWENIQWDILEAKIYTVLKEKGLCKIQ